MLVCTVQVLQELKSRTLSNRHSKAGHFKKEGIQEKELSLSLNYYFFFITIYYSLSPRAALSFLLAGIGSALLFTSLASHLNILHQTITSDFTIFYCLWAFFKSFKRHYVLIMDCLKIKLNYNFLNSNLINARGYQRYRVFHEKFYSS